MLISTAVPNESGERVVTRARSQKPADTTLPADRIVVAVPTRCAPNVGMRNIDDLLSYAVRIAHFYGSSFGEVSEAYPGIFEIDVRPQVRKVRVEFHAADRWDISELLQCLRYRPDRPLDADSVLPWLRRRYPGSDVFFLREGSRIVAADVRGVYRGREQQRVAQWFVHLGLAIEFS